MEIEMSDSERYTQISCACSAVWTEDRMDPGPTCPLCAHYEPWPLLNNCKHLSVDDGCLFDLTATQLIELLEGCGFRGSASVARGRTSSGCWSYQHKAEKTTWTISVEVSRYTGADVVRSA